ncbi:uncharacterized protein [Periplaneta americana]|uniref:uncharacterized protein n=1 Tax=Periplaneta americana TaxID=6978 RepID=UPI0037E946B0
MEFYERRGGVANMAGELFEIKVLALLFLRGHSMTSDFRLATNMKHCGAFDDVVFQFKSLDVTNNWMSCFFQLKHKLNKQSLSIQKFHEKGSDFDLRKYFKAFCHITEQFSGNNNNPVFTGAVDNCSFILYTNCECDTKRILKASQDASGSILNSSDRGGFFTFLEENETDRVIFKIFDDLQSCEDVLNSVLEKSEEHTLNNTDIQKIKAVMKCIKDEDIEKKLGLLTKQPTKDSLVCLLNKFKKSYNLSKKELFLKKLQVFDGQSGYEALDEVIMKEINSICKTDDKETSKIYEELIRHVKDWWCGPKSIAEFLTKHTKFWTDMMQEREEKVKQLSSDKLGQIRDLGISFCNDEVIKLSTLLSSKGVVNVVAKHGVSLFSCIKVGQALQKLGYTNSIFTDLTALRYQQQDVMSLWPSQWCEFLVVDCGDNNDNFNYSVQGKLILVSCQEINNQFIHKDDFDFQACEEETKERILEKKVNFQGLSVSIGELTAGNSDLLASMSAQFVVQLLRGSELPKIGKELGKVDKYYIPRKLERKIVLKIDVLKDTLIDDIFILNGINRNDLIKVGANPERICSSEVLELILNLSTSSIEALLHALGIKRIIITEEETAFNQISEKFTNISVHLLHYEYTSDFIRSDPLLGKLVWNKSHGITDTLIQHLDPINNYGNEKCAIDVLTNTRITSLEPDFNMEFSEKTVLLTAEPGMGKSTYLTCLAQNLKQADPTCWVVRVNLNDHIILLKEISLSAFSTEECVSFLYKCVRIFSDFYFEEHLFRSSFMENRKMIILFDGFDEISPTYKDEVLTVINCIISMRKQILWVTSRPTFKDELEEALNILSFSLKPFTDEEQYLFLKKIWEKKYTDEYADNLVYFGKAYNIYNSIVLHKALKHDPKDRLKEFISSLLGFVSLSLRDKSFCSNPFNLCILDTLYVDNMVLSVYTGMLQLPHKLNIIEIYEKFIGVKLDVYYNQKKVEDETKPTVQDNREEQERLFRENHCLAALVSLFTDDVLQLFDEDVKQKCSYFLDRVKNGKEKNGIIVEVICGRPHFVHRTIAEYLAAYWLSVNYNRNRGIVKLLYTEKQNIVIREMFDRLLCRNHPLHEAVINENDSEVESLAKSGDVDTLDTGGRTALHLASYIGTINTNLGTGRKSNKLMEILLRYEPSVNIVDDILLFKPVQYADQAHKWVMVGQLLEAGSSAELVELQKNLIHEREKIDSPLSLAVRGGYTEMFELLIYYEIDINQSIGFNVEETPLHVAAMLGQLKIARRLLSLSVDVNSKDSYGNTPLIRACANGQFEMARLLIEEGKADVSPDLSDLVKHNMYMKAYLHSKMK